MHSVPVASRCRRIQIFPLVITLLRVMTTPRKYLGFDIKTASTVKDDWRSCRPLAAIETVLVGATAPKTLFLTASSGLIIDVGFAVDPRKNVIFGLVYCVLPDSRIVLDFCLSNLLHRSV